MTVTIGLVLVAVVLIAVFVYFFLQKEDVSVTDTVVSPSVLSSMLKQSSVDMSIFREWLEFFEITHPNFIKIKEEIQKKIIGMDDFLNSLIMTLLCWWHILIEWVPGLAKTKTIKTLSEAMDMEFKRIQFTPDMLPADIIGVEIFNAKAKEFEIKLGPIVSNIILADEINRTTPKVQSALLEAMQEGQVTISGNSYALPEPFLVLATQNPLEQEGTYPLPEAQLDRFLCKVLVDYPTQPQEKDILEMMEHEPDILIKKALTMSQFQKLKSEAGNVVVSDDVRDYITRLVARTREKNPHLLYGASPRGSIGLFFAAKALAFLQGREFVTHEDVQRIALQILRHRVGLSYDAQIDGISVDEVLLGLFSQVTLE